MPSIDKQNDTTTTKKTRKSKTGQCSIVQCNTVQLVERSKYEILFLLKINLYTMDK